MAAHFRICLAVHRGRALTQKSRKLFRTKIFNHKGFLHPRDWVGLAQLLLFAF